MVVACGELVDGGVGMASRCRWSCVALAVLGIVAGFVGAPARAQSGARRTRGTYGPRLSFGEFGYRMNSGAALGSVYGGLGRMNPGFGIGFGPGYPAGGMAIYSAAYTTPGVINPTSAGYDPPYAVYPNRAMSPMNPAIFSAPGPNYGRAPWSVPPHGRLVRLPR